MASVGRSVPRADAESKVKGEAVYGVDFELARTLYAALVRSPVAAGRILAIRTADAEAIPGVRAVVTARRFSAGWHWTISPSSQRTWCATKVSRSARS